MEEQRQTVRADLNVGVSLRVDDQEAVHKALGSRALSAEGIQLLLPGRIPTKEPVHLEIFLPSQPTPLKAEGEVAWINHLGDVYEGFYQVGIRFRELAESDRQRIEQLITAELGKLKPLPLEGA